MSDQNNSQQPALPRVLTFNLSDFLKSQQEQRPHPLQVGFAVKVVLPGHAFEGMSGVVVKPWRDNAGKPIHADVVIRFGDGLVQLPLLPEHVQVVEGE